MDIYLWDSYHDVFEGLGSFPVEYKIEFYSFVPVNINLEEFIRSESRKFLQGLIKKVANYNNSMFTVKKNLCKQLMCIYFMNWTRRSRNHITACLPWRISYQIWQTQSFFSVFEAKKWFWRNARSKNRTFWLPFGRYIWLHLPFGIPYAPE